MHSFQRAILSLLRLLGNTNLLCFMSVILHCCGTLRYDLVLYVTSLYVIISV